MFNQNSSSVHLVVVVVSGGSRALLLVPPRSQQNRQTKSGNSAPATTDLSSPVGPSAPHVRTIPDELEPRANEASEGGHVLVSLLAAAPTPGRPP